jgi:hypothetical protein
MPGLPRRALEAMKLVGVVLRIAGFEPARPGVLPSGQFSDLVSLAARLSFAIDEPSEARIDELRSVVKGLEEALANVERRAPDLSKGETVSSVRNTLWRTANRLLLSQLWDVVSAKDSSARAREAACIGVALLGVAMISDIFMSGKDVARHAIEETASLLSIPLRTRRLLAFAESHLWMTGEPEIEQFSVSARSILVRLRRGAAITTEELEGASTVDDDRLIGDWSLDIDPDSDGMLLGFPDRRRYEPVRHAARGKGKRKSRVSVGSKEARILVAAETGDPPNIAGRDPRFSRSRAKSAIKATSDGQLSLKGLAPRLEFSSRVVVSRRLKKAVRESGLKPNRRRHPIDST